MIDLIYRNENVQTIQAHCVHEHDTFAYAFGLNPRLEHIPSVDENGNRGEVTHVYALYKLANGGFGFEVMSKREIDLHAEKYSKAFHSDYSPWKTDYDSMAKKTVIKKLLKYAPLKTDVIRAVTTDSSIKSKIAVDMSEVTNEMDFEEMEWGVIISSSINVFSFDRYFVWQLCYIKKDTFMEFLFLSNSR